MLDLSSFQVAPRAIEFLDKEGSGFPSDAFAVVCQEMFVASRLAQQFQVFATCPLRFKIESILSWNGVGGVLIYG